MIPFRFIQCGDLHLGTPFKYLKSLGKQVDEAANRATYQSFTNIVDFAIDQQVHAVLIAGDIYDSENRNLEAQVRFAYECERLAEHKIPVFLVQGNHDPAESWTANITLPDSVYIFSATKSERKPLYVKGKVAAYIYGISCSGQNREDNVAQQLKPWADDPFSIGLFHGTVGAAADHETVGPTTLGELTASPMNYWAVGHIHKRQVLNESPYVVYAGNIQGLHKKELGAKGCYLVDVTAKGRVSMQFQETAPIRFEQVTIDIGALNSNSDMIEMIRHKKEMLRKLKKQILLEIVLTGEGALYELCSQAEVRQTWLEMAQAEERNKFNFVMPFSLTDRTRGVTDWSTRRQMEDMVGDYLRSYDTIGQLPAPEQLANIRNLIADRPESKRLGMYQELLTDDVLLDALRRAETEGARCLMGDTDED